MTQKRKREGCRKRKVCWEQLWLCQWLGFQKRNWLLASGPTGIVGVAGEGRGVSGVEAAVEEGGGEDARATVHASAIAIAAENTQASRVRVARVFVLVTH
jgi:hypothetical protein